MGAPGVVEADEAELSGLVARVRDGDTDALGELYRQCRSNVVRYLAMRMDSCPGDVEDVAHETFLRVGAEAQAIDFEINDVRGWLCGWVAKLALGDHRQSARWRYLNAVDIAKDAIRRGPTESAAEREARPVSPRVVTALARLTPSQRRSMQLRYLDGLPAEAAAEMAGSTAKAIVQNCVMARRRLRTELADLAPPQTSWLQDVSKAEAVRTAFGAVGRSDVSAVLGWLRERGVVVQDSYVYAIRKGHRGVAPDPIVERAPELAGLSKADAVRTAFSAVGRSDVAAVLGWLRERGVSVGGPYVYAVREGRYQRAGTDQPADARTPADRHLGTAAVDTGASTRLVVPDRAPTGLVEAGHDTSEDDVDISRADREESPPDETAAAVARAHQAVTRLRRHLPPAAAAGEQARAEELTRWHADDQVLQVEAADHGDPVVDRCAALEGSTR